MDHVSDENNMIKAHAQTGLLSSVNYVPSPHCDARPDNVVIDMIVIHGISLPPGQFGNNAIEDFFCGKLKTHTHPYFKTIADLKVSAHFLIKRHGEIIQFVPLHMRAWHAGKSEFQGKSACNDFSIGIELEGTDDLPYENIQYTQLSKIILAIRSSFTAITDDRIVSHSDIAPGRKTDPGPTFDWALLKEIGI